MFLWHVCSRSSATTSAKRSRDPTSTYLAITIKVEACLSSYVSERLTGRTKTGRHTVSPSVLTAGVLACAVRSLLVSSNFPIQCMSCLIHLLLWCFGWSALHLTWRLQPQSAAQSAAYWKRSILLEPLPLLSPAGRWKWPSLFIHTHTHTVYTQPWYKHLPE